MSKQQTLSSYFNVRKTLQPSDQHATKRRKVVVEEATRIENTQEASMTNEPSIKGGKAKLDVERLVTAAIVVRPQTRSRTKPATALKEKQAEETTAAVTTSVFDDHILAYKPVVTGTPKGVRSESVNKRTRKRDALGNDPTDQPDEKQPVLFTIGKRGPTAKKKLQLDEKKKEDSDISKPVIKEAVEQVQEKAIINEVQEKAKAANEPQGKGPKEVTQPVAVEKTLQKMTPAEMKAKLSKVTKLSDLKAQLKTFDAAVNKLQTDKAQKKEASKESIEAAKAAVEAAKALTVDKEVIIPHSSSDIPLPKKFKLLHQIFEVLDQVVSMKHNRGEIIRSDDVIKAVQNVVRRNITVEHFMQIHSVFPKAFTFTWEQLRDRMGRMTNNLELHIEVNLKFKDSDDEKESKGGPRLKLTPQLQSERLRIFHQKLTQIVDSHHREFLQSLGIKLSAKIYRLHEKFDLENIPDLVTDKFPAKPIVDRITSAEDMLKRLGPGVNPRLESVLKARAENAASASPSPSSVLSPAKAAPPAAPAAKAVEVKIHKSLQGLPPHLLALLKAKEHVKQVQSILQSPEDEKEIALMEELVEIAPLIVNCHRTQRNGAAVEAEALFKASSSSYGRKSPREMETLIRLFIKLVPECLEARSYDKVEYIKQKKPVPDINLIRKKLEDLVNEKKKSLLNK